MKKMFHRFVNIFSVMLMGLTIMVAPMLTVIAAEDTTIDVPQEVLDDSVDTKGVFRVGMEANYAPFNWSQPNADNGAIPIRNSSGEYANGYDVQMAKKVAEGLGLELQIEKMEWDGLPPALMSGKVDAIIAGMSATPERKEQIDFTDNYYDSHIVLVMQKDNQFAQANSINDFKGAKITGQQNTFHYDMIDQISGATKQTAMDSFPTMISSVVSGKSDAYVSEEPGAMAAVVSNTSLTYIDFDDGKGFNLEGIDTGIAIGLRKGSELTPYINTLLETITEEERNDLMKEMVALNHRQENDSFWGQVASLWKMYGSQFLSGAMNTMLIALVSTIVGSVIGLIIAVLRAIKIDKKKHLTSYYLHKVLNFILGTYVEVFRGTPMMVQAMLIFYGLKLFFNIDLSSMTAAFLIVSINTGAYLAEVIRGGIQSIDEGQFEGAKAIGMTHMQTMRHVVLPQAIVSVLPTLGNEFVINIKDTSVLNVIAVTELFFITRSAAGSTYLTFQAFFIASLIYFVLTFATTRLLNFLEKRITRMKEYEVEEVQQVLEQKGV